MRTNLGPKGTLKMLVGGSGSIKLSKAGNTLLREMLIQNPTAMMIARAAVTHNDTVGDGNTSIVLLVGELLKQAERYLSEGVHPHMIRAGWRVSEIAVLKLLDNFQTPIDIDRKDILKNLAQTSLRTKIEEEKADQFSELVVDAAMTISNEKDGSLDLQLIEFIQMRHKFSSDTKLIKGLVLDHGSRHPEMPRQLEQCFILSCNISMEYEKSEVNSGFFYTNVHEKEKMFEAERQLVDMKVKAVIKLKREVCKDNHKSFVVINQKGIDLISLDLLAKEGILGLRRAKKSNAERLKLSCGGYCVSSVEELCPDCLGFAGIVYDQILEEDKYTFVEDVKYGHAATFLIKGSTDYSIERSKDAIYGSLRSIKNMLEDKTLVLGAGAFEISASHHLILKIRKKLMGKSKLGVVSYSQALLSIPKALAHNAGFDVQEIVINAQHEHENGKIVGIDLKTGEPLDALHLGIYDNYNVKRQILTSATIVASQLLLVDEIIQIHHD
eukprot:gnl/MRDRNA2_/MRDRNA2_82622_c0_seq1.p1 gnl/MRDRNA2_/MRDRNA2_82622_c0~~gnl/MRDRNA2_/MRDRNA2_82622_c0_seq1.p1  ORF type:complete len:532 (+),score=32.87 gnl/MRDRNA2_/MRDRNA2_82622_c0_seq1:106-1596(+)